MSPASRPSRLPAALLAVAPPTLLAWNVAPSATALNQLLSLAGFALFLLLAPPRPPAGASARALRSAWPLQAALALLLLAALASGLLASLPGSLMLSAAGLLAMAMLVAHAAAVARADDDGEALPVAFAWAWLATGLLGLALGVVQVFAPTLADGDWIAVSSMAGRAVGNLRQPNHLSSVLLWAAIAAATLLQLRRLRLGAAAAAFAALVFGVVLTASRTGLLSVVLLALWGLLDRRLARPTRALLLAAPLIYALAWLAMVQWAELAHHTFGGAARLAETDVSSSRFGIWADTLALIRANPWTGVGLGEFNLAWTLTPFPGRPTAFFDHTHNLPLQFAVELGLPLAALVLGLLLLGLARMAVQARRAQGEAAITQRMALAFVLMIGLHSLLEYPLWYAYFLLPTAWLAGFGLGAAAPQREAGARRGGAGLAVAAALALALGVYAAWDYARVAAIYSAADVAPLQERIARGQASPFFAYQADYAAATSEVDEGLRARGLQGATHFLLDTRLMMAWAEELARRGELERARHLADRLREFHNPASRAWFAACDEAPATLDAPAAQAAPSPPPFQCAHATRAFTWRDFTPALPKAAEPPRPGQ